MASSSLPSLRAFLAARPLLLAVALSAPVVACGKSQVKKTAADECPPVAGRALAVEGVRLRADSPPVGDGVIDTQDALDASGYRMEGEARPVPPDGGARSAERPPFDFGKHRIAYATVRQNPNASLVWVVETPTDIVVGVRIDAYCGGAAPPDSVVGALVPASSKPVRFARCSTGACDPNVARP